METVLHEIPGFVRPDPAKLGMMTAHDGTRLRYAIFKSPVSPAKGTVVLVHGRSESIEKYYEVIADLTAAGLWVATYDLRGQGGSDRPLKDRLRGHIRQFASYERDLEQFLDEIVLPDARLPLFLLGHSTGGLIALAAAPRLSGRIARMVLSAPFIGLHGEALSARQVFALARLLCLMGLGNRPLASPKTATAEDNPLTTDMLRYARNASLAHHAPDLALGAPTARWLHECARAMARVVDPVHLTRITIPTLLLAPMRDGVVPFSAQEDLAKRFRAAQLVAIAGARHEVLQEQDRYRLQALAAITAFLPGSDPAERWAESQSGFAQDQAAAS